MTGASGHRKQHFIRRVLLRPDEPILAWRRADIRIPLSVTPTAGGGTKGYGYSDMVSQWVLRGGLSLRMVLVDTTREKLCNTRAHSRISSALTLEGDK